MVSTYTTNKHLEQPAHGDYVNSWDIPLNNDMGYIDQAFGGTTNLNGTSGSATLTFAQYRSLIVNVSGALSADVTYSIPSQVGGQWIVQNQTSGNYFVYFQSAGATFTATISNGSGGAGTILNVTGGVTGVLAVGQVITTAGVASGTKITAYGTGTGGIGTYTVSISQNVSSSILTSSGAVTRIPQGTNELIMSDGANIYAVTAGNTQPIGPNYDQIFYTNDPTLTANYTLVAGKNYGTFGPLTIPTGVTLTVNAGVTYTIV
jgi:hypothetical protein